MKYYCIPKKYTANGIVDFAVSNNIAGYVFCNTGASILNVRPILKTVSFIFDEFTLEPGDWIDTRTTGMQDAGTYQILFKAQQLSGAPAVSLAPISEVTVSIFIILS